MEVRRDPFTTSVNYLSIGHIFYMVKDIIMSNYTEPSGKRLGFQMKGSSKRQRIVNIAPDHKEQIEEITAIEDSKIASTFPDKDAPLVIPLKPTVSSNREPVVAGSELDHQAALELIKEVKRNGEDDTVDQGLVIGSSIVAGTDSSKSHAARSGKRAPLLLQNVAPELLLETDGDKRFKMDMELRAEDMNIRSDAYDAVPVEQFGAALLRGMGWSGQREEKEYKIAPRENRLGLGALPKPPEDTKSNKHKGGPGKSGDKDMRQVRREESQRQWQHRAEQRLQAQQLVEGDVVWLRAPTDLAGKRALVVAVRGVPGLDKIR